MTLLSVPTRGLTQPGMQILRVLQFKLRHAESMTSVSAESLCANGDSVSRLPIAWWALDCLCSRSLRLPIVVHAISGTTHRHRPRPSCPPQGRIGRLFSQSRGWVKAILDVSEQVSVIVRAFRPSVRTHEDSINRLARFDSSVAIDQITPLS